MKGQEYTDQLKKELVSWVRSVIGPIASPDIIQWAPNYQKPDQEKL